MTARSISSWYSDVTLRLPDPEPTSDRAASLRTGAGLDWWDWGRVGLGRKAVLIDVGEQGLRFGVQHPEPGVLAPQLLGFFLDLLDLALQLFHPQFVLHHAPLVAGIASPIEHRQKLSPPRQR